MPSKNANKESVEDYDPNLNVEVLLDTSIEETSDSNNLPANFGVHWLLKDNEDSNSNANLENDDMQKEDQKNDEHQIPSSHSQNNTEEEAEIDDDANEEAEILATIQEMWKHPAISDNNGIKFLDPTSIIKLMLQNLDNPFDKTLPCLGLPKNKNVIVRNPNYPSTQSFNNPM